MAGRGFLKSRLAEKMAAKRSDEPSKPPTPQELPKSEELLEAQKLTKKEEESIPKLSVPVVCSPSLIGKVQQSDEPSKPPTPQELPKSEELLEAQKLTKKEEESIPKISVPIVCSPSLIGEVQRPVRGRRAMLAHLGTRENIAKEFSGLALTSPASVEKSSEIQLQLPQTLSAVMPKDKSPVVNRVLKKSDKDSYQMVQLSSNYIKIELEQDKGIYEYRVDYNPPIDAKSARFMLLNGHRDKFPVKIFDGTLLYIPNKLPQNVTTLVGTLNDETKITMTVTYKRKNSLSECIHFYNVFLRTIMKILGLVEFGRSFFDREKRMLLPEYKLEVWPGFVTTIDEFENGLYMCCEVSHRILRVQTVLQIMTEVGTMSKNNNKDSKQEIMAVLCGSTVITHYNRKTYRIDDIDFNMTPLSKFDQNGTEISYVDYYKKMYDIEIKNVNQPMLVTKAKRKDINKKIEGKDSDICCLVPELCNLTGLTEAMKSDFKLMKGLQSHTLVSPEVRQKSIVDFVNRINEHEVASKKFKDWGLIMRPLPVKLEGPVYKREAIILGNGIRKQVGNNMDWGMDVAKNAMFTAVNLYKWAIMYNSRDEPTAKSFCKQLSICGRPLGMDISQPVPIKVQGTNPEVFASAINTAVKTNSELQMVVIIFPNQREDRYNAVKRICCAQIGIPSQVIVSRTLSKPERLQSITQKIALQMNCKLGGACWAIDIPLKNTMIVGIDVYHEKGKQLSSVVGFVASMDRTFTDWYSVAGMQKSTHQELMRTIQDSFNRVVHQFKSKNGSFPEKIIIYRDGVSDGDLKHVEEIELRDLEETFKTYPGDYCPTVTCIIVQKRINTRVFQYLDKKYSNPSPGTVIDNTITRRNFFDFFLVSQNVRQGTVNPTHYIVLKNDCKLSTENVQRLSYKLCHLYYNWCGTVKVPGPVQYAHKLAYLIGQNVRQMPSEKLSNSLYFL